MNFFSKLFWGLLSASFLLSAQASTPILIHSHNDYLRTVPFYQAYAQHVSSIEADVFLKDGKLLVGHDFDTLESDRTFLDLYVQPLVRLFERNGGFAWHDSKENLQLLVELKSPCHETLRAVVDLLDRWPSVFNPKTNAHAVRVVITGNVPAPADFGQYPDWISFDGNVEQNYTPKQLERVALFSADFRNYSSWNGKGTLIDDQRIEVEKLIDYVHQMHKPIRFWNAPEGVTVYYTFFNMGIDYVNTDHPETCAAYFEDFANRNFQMGATRSSDSGVTGTKRLDKTTRDFSGFQNDKLQLSQSIDIYTPSYLNDGVDRPIKNVIFLIGDGMGLQQLVAAAYANGGLTTLQMKYLGLQSNHSSDAFTTDSAAAGSALATGVAHSNRHISMSDDGHENPSLTEFFKAKNYATGVLTLGNVADATPTAFYGHSVERDLADELTRYLLKGHVDLLVGSGIDEFEKRQDQVALIPELKKQYNFIRAQEQISDQNGKTICIDERMGDAAEESNLNLLADATRRSIGHLSKMSENGFFLMVEGAKIDYAGHSKCLPGIILETLSFDLAVAEALKFADQNGETLVIVTADHETGALVLLDGDLANKRVSGICLSDDHTPIMIPVYSYGPCAQHFIGSYENTHIANQIRTLFK